MTAMVAEDLAQIPMSPYLAASLERAAQYASAQAHREVTLEHVLLALAEDPEASVILRASDVDIARLQTDVSNFVGNISDRQDPNDPSPVSTSPDLQRILEAAAEAAKQGQRREINGAILLAAIVGDGGSSAAHLLRGQGLTFEATIAALRDTVHHQVPPPEPEVAPLPPEPEADALQPAAPPPPAPSLPPPPSAAIEEPTTEDLLASARQRVDTVSARAEGGQSRPSLEPQWESAATPPEPEPVPPAPRPVAPPPPQPPLPSLDETADAPDTLAGQRPPFGEADPASPPPAPANPDWAPPQSPGQAERAPPRLQRVPPPLPPDAGLRPPRSEAPPPRPGPQLGTNPEVLDVRPQQSAGGPARAPSPGQAPGANLAGGPPRGGAGVQPQHAQAPHIPPWVETGSGASGTLQRQPPGPTPLSPPSTPSAQHHPRSTQVRVETGQLVENIPRKMKTGVSELVEVRIARANVKALAQGLQGGGAAYKHEAMITKAMSVKLRAPDGGFWVEAASPETQWIDNVLGVMTDDFASWRWTVTPKASGRKKLQLVVSARTVGSDGLAAETALPDQLYDVRVAVNYGQASKRAAIWLVAAVFGGVLARFGEDIFVLAKSMVSTITGA